MFLEMVLFVNFQGYIFHANVYNGCMQLIKKFFVFLDSTSMYRVVLYALSALALAAIVAAGFGELPYDISVTNLLSSLAILLSVSIATHEVYRRIYGAPANIESSFITALILFFVAMPLQDVMGAKWLALLAFTAISSKYVVAWNNRHIFNPSAFALVALGMLGAPLAFWWVGTPVMFIPVLLAGLAVVKKLRRWQMVGLYLALSFVFALYSGFDNHGGLTAVARQFFFSWPVLYFAAFMLTEPLTKPPTDRMRLVYVTLIFIIGALPIRINGYAMTPELALCIGNLFTLAVGMRSRVVLSLLSRTKLADNTEEFVFAPSHPVPHEAGQYLEWTLPHENVDVRGVRRYFTIASAPSEEYVRLGTKFVPEGAKGSSFKETLKSLVPGDKLWVTARSGSFTLPEDTQIPLVFIAGGIGVTPFISMLREMLIKGEGRDVVMFNANKKPSDIAYRDLLEQAQEGLGVRVVNILSDSNEGDEKGFITSEMVKKYVNDPLAPVFYLSGPSMMVDNYKKMLRDMGVSMANIRTDYFPGFA